MNKKKQNEFDIYEYFYIFNKNIKIFILIFAVIVLSTFFYSILQTPIYKTCTKVRIEEDNYNRLISLTTNAPTMMFLGKKKTLETEIEIMKNYSFAEKVVQNLIAQDVIKKTIKEKKIIFKDIEKDKNNFYQFIEKLPFKKNIKYGIKNNVDKLLNKNEFLSDIYESSTISLFLEKKDLLNYSTLVLQIFNNISIYSLIETNIVIIESKGDNPYKIKNVADTYAQIFIEENNQYKKTEARSTRKFLAEQLVFVKDNLEKTEKDLKSFKQTKEIFFPIDAEFNKIISKISNFETDKFKLEMQIQELEKRISLIKDSFSSLQNKIISFDISLINEYKNKLIELEIERIKLLETFTVSHQKIKNIDNQIFSIKQKINEEVKKLVKNENSETISYNNINLINELSNLESDKIIFQSKAKALDDFIKKTEKEIHNLSENEFELGKLIRSCTTNEQIYVMLLTKYENARLAENIELGDISIVQYAILPCKPISPDIVKNIIASISLGILIGIIVLLFLQNFNQTIESTYDVERYLKLPIIGYIPKIEIKKLKSLKKQKDKNIVMEIKEQLVSYFASNSIVSESYKSLKINMQFTNINKNKIILITSPSSGDGKTTTVINLAITMAELGDKILLIDGDLRKPTIHKVFELEKKLGLTDFIINNEIKANQIIQPTFMKNLYIIPSGTIPPNPSVLLNSNRLDELFCEVKNDFTNILVDSPPVIIADAAILGTKATACLLVVSSGKTNKNLCSHTVEIMKKVNSNIIGVVLNNINMKMQHPYNYKYYDDYYEKGSKK
ncbi:MAG: polysaccharide biosynthesis tyrosine autokinase [bacterium]